MFGRAKSGYDVVYSAIQSFMAYPELIAPLLLSWCIYASTVIYFRFGFNWLALTPKMMLATLFGIFLFFSILLCFSACWLLEMIEQIESGRDLSLSRALATSLGPNLVRMLPIAFIWATIWFILAIIDALTSKRRSNDNRDQELSYESATRVLAGTDNTFTWLGLTLRMLHKLVRMLAFMSLPAVCWQGLGPFSAIRESLRTARAHFAEFLTGYTLSGLVGVFIFLPVSIPVYLHVKKIAPLPDEAWLPILIYIAFTWSFVIYIEQMFTAELYLWHLNWKKAVQQARADGMVEPKLSEVKRPSLLDGIDSLKTVSSREPVSLDRERYLARNTKEAIESLKGKISTRCTVCHHQIEIARSRELPLYDYDLNATNGIQLKCPKCASLITVRLNAKHG